MIDKFQPCYYVAESFQSARKDLKTYCQLTPRSLILRYNPRTESIDELNDPSSLLVLANEIRGTSLAFDNFSFQENGFFPTRPNSSKEEQHGFAKRAASKIF